MVEEMRSSQDMMKHIHGKKHTAKNRTAGYPKVLFVDQVTAWSLLRMCMFGYPLESIWYFEPLSPSAKKWIRLLHYAGVLRARLHRVNYNIGQVRDDRGEPEGIQLINDLRAICSRIRNGQFVDNPLIKAMASQWEMNKVILYFEKFAEKDLRPECLRIRLVRWIIRTQLCVDPSRCILLVRYTHWFPYLETHARSQSIHLRGYRQYYGLKKIAEWYSWLLKVSVKVLPGLLRSVLRRLRCSRVSVCSRSAPAKSASGKKSVGSKIAIRYWHRTLSFDPAERSEFFWLNGSGIPYSEILLYDYVADKPLDTELANQLDARGIKLFGSGPEVSRWHPTKRILAVWLRTELKLTRNVFVCLMRGQRVSLYYISKLMVLAMEYAYWYDFYAANRVRVDVGTVLAKVSQVLALDKLNGVSCAYQYSISDIVSPSTLLSAGENVQFIFSSTFEWLWDNIKAPVDRFVRVGFVYDSAFQALRGLGRVAQIRNELQERGVRFTLCFFDENSRDHWSAAYSNEDAARNYEYLLKWLLAEPTLGIIFKPKKPTNLLERINRLSGLINQAERTGRCKFLISDTSAGNVYPAEAALMADVSIGILGGATAALETRLAGVPTVLIDTWRIYHHPFYKWGRNRVIFNDWESLRAMLEQYRTAPERCPEFGDWSLGLDALDLFQDGQASLRMSFYIRRVYEALKRGIPKQTALAMASGEFAQRWGDGHIKPARQPAGTVHDQ